MSTTDIKSREEFFKVYGRYPVSKEDTEFVDFGDDGDDEVDSIIKKVQDEYDLDTTPDTPQGTRSPEVISRIEGYKQELDWEQKQKQLEKNEEELHSQQVRNYWDLQKQKQQQQKKERPKGGRTKRNRRSKPSMRRKKTHVFRRKSNKRHRHHSSRRK